MPVFEKRPPEMYREVAVLQERAVTAERGGGPPAPLGTYIRLQAGLASYAEWREKALTGGLAWLTPDSGATAKSQQERWTNGFSQRGGEAFKMLNEQVSRDEDPIESTFELMAMQESIAYAQIAKMPLAGFMGQLREHLRDLEKYRTDLNNTWKELVGQDERIDGQIAGLRVQILEMFKKAVSEARGWAPRLESAIGDALFAWEKKEEPSPDPSIAPVAKTAFDTVHMIQVSLEQLTRSAQSLYGNEQTIHTMFGNTRQRLQEHLEKVNKNTIGRAWSDACSETKDAADKCPKDGQKADARVLAENAIRASESLVKDFHEAWDKFYAEFEGRFTGEVSDQTVEQLAEQEFFNRFWRDVESLNLPGEFRTAADRVAKCESVSLDKLTDDQRRRFKEIIHERIEDIEEEIRKMDSSFFDRFKLQFIDVPRGLMVEKLRKLPGFRK